MQKLLSRAGLFLMAALAAFVALYSFRFFGVLFDVWVQMSPGVRQVIEQFPVRALMHMVVAPVALLIGPLQFIPSLRARYPRVHRRVGKVYVSACTIAGVAGFFTALHASGGPVAGVGFSVLAVLWVASSLLAWRAAVARQFQLHRFLMRLSYALTFAAVTLRLQIPIGAIWGGYKEYSPMSVWLAYTSWIPNVVVVMVYSIARRAEWARIRAEWAVFVSRAPHARAGVSEL